MLDIEGVNVLMCKWLVKFGWRLELCLAAKGSGRFGVDCVFCFLVWFCRLQDGTSRYVLDFRFWYCLCDLCG